MQTRPTCRPSGDARRTWSAGTCSRPSRSARGDSRGARELADSLRTVADGGEPGRLPLLQYDLEVPAGSGRFEERWWAIANVAVPRPDGSVAGVVSCVQDVTEVVRQQERSQADRATVEQMRVHAQSLEADLSARSHELAATAAAEALATRRLTGLAEAALELAGAESLQDLVNLVVHRGLVALGADGGAVGVRDDETGMLRLTLTESFDPAVAARFTELPLEGPLPACVSARSGRPVLLADRQQGLAFAPEMAEVYAVAGKVAWASLPMQVGNRLVGSLTASWDEPHAFTAVEVDLMAAFAAQCASALERLQVRQAERRAATATRRLSEALQRSLLTEPPQPDHLQIAVRYQPAAQEAQIGGDWYDAFVVSGGKTSLVVGDVAGHDRDAAAAMAQVRNVLRGVAHARREPPASVLSGLDRAMRDLAVPALATAVLAQVEQTESEARQGLRVLRWSNAGHPPPVLLHPDGHTELLSRPPDLLLGLDPDTDLHDHTAVLRPGATVLLYTDGLVERRDASLDEGLEWLCGTVGQLADLPLEQLCDALLSHLDEEVEDDVALLAIRAYAEDGPRPPEAGPSVLPPGLEQDGG